jgi:superfamily II DNA or RNA helicase
MKSVIIKLSLILKQQKLFIYLYQLLFPVRCITRCVVSKKVLNSEDVYDITVEDNHNFFANNILVHNCHGSTCDSYRTILEGNRQAMRFGFSGTIPDETEYKGLELRELFGDVVCRVTNKELIDKDISARPLVRMIEYYMDASFDDKVEDYKAEIRNSCFKYRNYGKDAQGVEIKRLEFSVPTYTNLLRTFVMNYSIRQNEVFTHIVEKILQKHKGKSIVLMVDWIDYGASLGKRFNIPLFTGQTKNRELLLKDFAEGRVKEIIATSVIDEGLSIDRIEVLILATAGSSERQFLQRLGRGLRKKLGANQLLLYDFCRWGHSFLIEPSRTRVKLWCSEGFEIEYLEEKDL